jgi:hypothetical protein
MKRLLVALGALSFVASNSYSAITVSSDTDTGGWNTVGGNYDYLVDQQTGQPASDIVGGVGGTYNAYDAGFFTNWDAGTASTTDGVLGFRVRLDEKDTNKNPATFARVLWVGMDADLDGDVDVFMGVDNAGSSDSLGIYDAGNGLNNSPNTTSISSTAATSYTVTSSNYNYRAVAAADGGTTLDITTGTSGDTDYYVTFTINFQDVVNFLNTAAGGNISINESSSFRYVLGTATQHNSLNQDLGNVNGNTNSSTTWEQLGGFSPIVNAAGQVVPEPSSLLLGLAALPLVFRRRRN